MVFVRWFARPVGPEPKMYSTIEEAHVYCQCDGGYCHPWCQPEILEFDDEDVVYLYMSINCPQWVASMCAINMVNQDISSHE